MGLLSDKNKNKKINRFQNGRSGGRRAGFFDLRRESPDEFDPLAEEKNDFYEEERTEDANSRSGYSFSGSDSYDDDYSGSGRTDGYASGNSGGGYSAGSYANPAGLFDRTDDRPYRERHRVEVDKEKDARAYSDYRSGRGLEVPEISRHSSRVNFGTSSRVGKNRYGTGNSSYANSRSDGYKAGNASYANSRSDGYGTPEEDLYEGMQENRSGSRDGQNVREIQSDWNISNRSGQSSRASRNSYRTTRNTVDTSRNSSGTYRNTPGSSRSSTGTSRNTPGSSRSSSGTYRNTPGSSRSSTGTSRNTFGSSRSSTGTSRNTADASRNTSGTSWDASIDSWSSTGTSRNTADTSRNPSRYSRNNYGDSQAYTDYNDRGRSGGGGVRGSVPGRNSQKADIGTDREVSADLFAPNAFSGRGRISRGTRAPLTPPNEPRNNTVGRRPTYYGRGTSSQEDWAEEQYAGFYSAPQNMNSSRRGNGAYVRGKRGTEQDFFYEEDLPAENLLWDGIGDDPDETQFDKRNRQRERMRQEREKEIKKMYFRIGSGAAVALVVIIGVIVVAVIGFRNGKNKNNPATAGAETQQTAEGAGADAQQTTGSAGKDTGTSSESSSETGKNTEASDQKDMTESVKETAGGTAEAGGDAAEKTDGESADAVAKNSEDASKQQGTETADAEGQADKETTSVAESTEVQNSVEVTAKETGYLHQDEWNLILVNPWHKLPEGYTVETTSLMNGESVDSRCYSALQQMLNDCQEKSGGIPIVCSSYRPHEKQVRLYEEQVAKLMSEGKTREEAEKEAGTVVAVPGTSEHELGLAVDICDSENQLLDDSQANTSTQQWLMKNCWDYGFILRYPVDKSAITGIIYEPWHYRYVGVEAAREIRDRGVCLEEYLAG